MFEVKSNRYGAKRIDGDMTKFGVGSILVIEEPLAIDITRNDTGGVAILLSSHRKYIRRAYCIIH